MRSLINALLSCVLVGVVFALFAEWFHLPLFAQSSFEEPTRIRPRVRVMGVDERGQEIRFDTLFVKASRAMQVFTFPRRFDANLDTNTARTIYCVPPNGTSNDISALDRYSFTPWGIKSAFVNVLGQRLRQNPQTTLLLQHSAQESTKQNAALLKSYLEGVWRIPNGRIRLGASARTDARIALEGSPALFEPTIFVDSVLRATPPVLRFYLTTATLGIPLQWAVNIKQRKKELRSSIKAGGRLRPVVDWKVAKEQGIIRQIVSDSILCDLEIRYEGDIPNERSVATGFFAKVVQSQINDTIPRAFLCTLAFLESAPTLTPEALAALRRWKQFLALEQGKMLLCTSSFPTDSEAEKALHKKRVKELAKQLGITEDRILPVLQSVPVHGDMEVAVQ